MVDFIRKIVSGDKKRYKDRKFDLDLTYITPRVIAMAFPGAGITSIYRNDITDVAKFLNERHGRDYLVFNLSGKKYDNTKFNDRVLEFDWIDHQAPQLQLLFYICKIMNDFLTKGYSESREGRNLYIENETKEKIDHINYVVSNINNNNNTINNNESNNNTNNNTTNVINSNNVNNNNNNEDLNINTRSSIVVHCNAGKGRTGTVICCFMLFSGMFDNVEDCMRYYSKKRFSIGQAVTQPGQVRYIKYFYRLLRENHFFPLRKTLKSITVKHIPLKDKKGEIRPYLEIYFDNSDQIAFTNKKSYYNQLKINYNSESEVTVSEKDFQIEVIGDVTIKLYTQEFLTIKKLGRISFNTAFLSPEENFLEFNLSETDPDSMMKKTYINKNFKISLELVSECKCQNTNFPISLCDICNVKLKDHLKIWKTIHNIIEVSCS